MTQGLPSPLRDAAFGLRPSRSSQLARLLHILADDAGKLGIDGALKELDPIEV